jgi:glycosyltransferase involved in cell wall biosynthesis
VPRNTVTERPLVLIATLMSRPRLLYVTPVMPAISGNGLAMRAGVVLEGLAHHYAVSLLVIPLYDTPAPQAETPLSALAEAIAVVPPGNAEPLPAFAGVQFDVVHVFRLAMAPFAEPFLQALPTPARHIDLDELDTATHRRIADLRRANGDGLSAGWDELQIRRWKPWEDRLAEWDRVYVASPRDRERMAGRLGCRVRVLPNAVRPGGTHSASRSARADHTLLFVGTLGYYPNEDAVVHFCTDVLPLIRSGATRPVRLLVAGAGAGRRLESVATLPDVTLLGMVEDLAPWYAAADAVVVPLRAGGGTRIKLLEAFAHGCPAISTPLGAEGIDVTHGTEALIAADPAAFAECCLSVLEDPAYGASLAASGRELWRRAHSVQAVIEAVTPEPAPAPTAV